VDVAEAHGEEPIIIGLVADTHGLVRDDVFGALAGVAMILHAGDVGGDAVLDALAAIAPVRAVYGNVDGWNPRLLESLQITTGGVSIHLSHGHELGSPTVDKLLAAYTADVIVYGHTHRALVHRADARLVINPGAAGPRRFDLKPSVAKLAVHAGRADVEIVPLAP
jgi:putative phosphoesterase